MIPIKDYCDFINKIFFACYKSLSCSLKLSVYL